MNDLALKRLTYFYSRVTAWDSSNETAHVILALA